MLIKHSNTSNIIRFTLKNSSTGIGLTGLTNASTGLIIATICNNEATTTVYTQAASNIETIAALGTYAAPTASKCRFKEVDATNHKGLYEFQFANARFAIASARSMAISVTGASSLLDADYEIQLVSFDPHDSVRMGLTAMPNAAANGAGGLPISDAGGLDLDTKLANAHEITAARMGALTDWINGGRLDLLLDAIPTTAMRGTDNGPTKTEMDAGHALLATETKQDIIDTNVDQIETAVITNATGVDIAADIIAVKAETVTIVNDTNELQINQGNWLTAVGFSTHDAMAVKTAIEAAGSDLNSIMIALINKMIITEVNGNTEQFNDAGGSLGSIAAAFSTDGTFTTRKRMVI